MPKNGLELEVMITLGLRTVLPFIQSIYDHTKINKKNTPNFGVLVV